MSWIYERKRIWRLSLIALLLLAVAGPWAYERVYVPVEYPCSNGVRLEGGYCGLSMPGIMFFFWGIIGSASSFVRLITGELAVVQGIRELLLSLLLLGTFLPVLALLFLVVRGKGSPWLFLVGSILVVVMGLLFNLTEATALHWTVWGIWLYFSLVAAGLALEILIWRRVGERKLAVN